MSSPAFINTLITHAQAYGIVLEDDVLQALYSVDRGQHGGSEYDQAEAIGYGQSISQPFIVAAMTQAVLTHAPSRTHVVEIGTGSGYQAAILATLFTYVTTYERIKPLAQKAEKLLSNLPNVTMHHSHTLLPDQVNHPADAIIVTCAVYGPLDTHWIWALKEHGVIVAPHADHSQDSMRLRLYQKQKDQLIEKKLFRTPLYCRFVPYVPKTYQVFLKPKT